MGAPVGLPSTGLYGLIDLIGLDVMDLVGKNLASKLPAGDPGLAFVQLPATEQEMRKRGQLGHKSGGGFYRMRTRDNAKIKEVYDLSRGDWRSVETVALGLCLEARAVRIARRH